MATSATTAHRRLDASKQEFRLLELRSAESIDDRIDCRLTTVRLSDEPEFIALSSLYGEPSETETIIIGGRSVTITRHLAAALRHIRTVFFPHTLHRDGSSRRSARQSRTPGWLRQLMKHMSSILPSEDAEQRTPLLVWVDVLCVNQQDEREKLKQVNDMRQIYRAAQIVVGWLGMKTEHTEAGLACLNDIEENMPKHWGDPGDREEHPWDYAPTHAWFKKIAHLWAPGPGNTICFTLPHWLGANDFMNRPYFQRRWILEEISMARYPTFMIGDTIVPWKQILRLNRLLEEAKYHDSNEFPPQCRAMIAELPLETAHKLLDEFAARRLLEDAKFLETSVSSHKSRSAANSPLVSSNQ